MEVNNTAFITNELEKKSYHWLVTGCAGFIGSNLVETLLGMGQQQVTGVRRFVYVASSSTYGDHPCGKRLRNRGPDHEIGGHCYL